MRHLLDLAGSRHGWFQSSNSVDWTLSLSLSQAHFAVGFILFEGNMASSCLRFTSFKFSNLQSRRDLRNQLQRKCPEEDSAWPKLGHIPISQSLTMAKEWNILTDYI